MEKLLLLSDLLIDDKESEALKNNEIDKLFAPELCELLFCLNQITVVNLEGPITESNDRQLKGDSPNIRSNPAIIQLMKRFPHLIVSGANNHISDYLLKGLQETQMYLQRAHIPLIGSAESLDRMCTEYDVELSGQRVCIYSVAQNEFSSIRYGAYGANGYDPLTTFDHIRELKGRADRVIVLFHAGKENYRYPTPQQQRICRKMVECGADLVVCQHSHCIGCQEEYLDGRIIYGTGNFYFNISADPLWDDSLIPVVTIGENQKLAVTYKVLHREKHHLTLLSGSLAEKVMKGFEDRSQQISKPSFISEQWADYCVQNRYYLLMKGFSRIPMRFIYRIDSMTGHHLFHLLFRNQERNLTDLNILRCEVINEMAQTIFSEIFIK